MNAIDEGRGSSTVSGRARRDLGSAGRLVSIQVRDLSRSEHCGQWMNRQIANDSLLFDGEGSSISLSGASGPLLLWCHVGHGRCVWVAEWNSVLNAAVEENWPWCILTRRS